MYIVLLFVVKYLLNTYTVLNAIHHRSVSLHLGILDFDSGTIDVRIGRARGGGRPWLSKFV